VSDVPGLYFLGLSWQHTRGSALLGWVKDDAAFIADRIEVAAGGRDRAADVHPESATDAPQAAGVAEGA